MYICIHTHTLNCFTDKKKKQPPPIKKTEHAVIPTSNKNVTGISKYLQLPLYPSN